MGNAKFSSKCKVQSAKFMRAGIYDPYLDTLGGGEKYSLNLGKLLNDKGYEVDLFWEGKDLSPEVKRRIGLNIDQFNLTKVPKNILEKLLVHPKYDLLFYVSDGSVPFMFGKKNILHFQVPFKSVSGSSLLNKIKFSMIKKIICNSYFTKTIIDKEFGVENMVIYPPIEVDKFSKGKKENIILAVARFSRLLQAKNQDILINAFKKMSQNGLRGWKLVLAGGSDVGSGNFIEKLQAMAEGYPIEILENISFPHLVDLYSRAKLFWSASGYGINEEENPEKVEHFGMAVVEAMAAGAVPLLVKKGGFREIIEDKKNGFFWESTEELEGKTLELVQTDLEKLQKEAIKRSQLFSKEKFYENFQKIIY